MTGRGSLGFFLYLDQGTIKNRRGELCGRVFSLVSSDYRHVPCFPGLRALVEGLHKTSVHTYDQFRQYINLLSFLFSILPATVPQVLRVFRVLLLLFKSLPPIPPPHVSNAYIWSEIHITIKSPSHWRPREDSNHDGRHFWIT